MQGDTRFIQTLQLRNLLSFGPDSPPIELGPLNVLIGPNSSGKSNVIESIELLRASASDLVAPIRAGGGTDEWLWKGIEQLPVARLDAEIRLPDLKSPLRHKFSFGSVHQRFALVNEHINYEVEELNENWNLGRNSSLRRPQPVDLPNDFLAEDASNLGLVLNFLERTGDVKDTIDAHLSRFYDQYRDFSVSVQGSTVQVFLREKDLRGWIPASRLSDGTLHFLCLATTLCHPSPHRS